MCLLTVPAFESKLHDSGNVTLAWTVLALFLVVIVYSVYCTIYEYTQIKRITSTMSEGTDVKVLLKQSELFRRSLDPTLRSEILSLSFHSKCKMAEMLQHTAEKNNEKIVLTVSL